MRASCRFALAVHILALLAHSNGRRITSQCLARSVNTHPVIVRRLLSSLQKAGLVETRKGAGFGSRLARDPFAIDLASIYRAVECDEPFPMPSRGPDASCPVGLPVQSALRRVFVSAREALESDLGRTNLADLLPGLKTPGDLTEKAAAA